MEAAAFSKLNSSLPYAVADHRLMIVAQCGAIRHQKINGHQ